MKLNLLVQIDGRIVMETPPIFIAVHSTHTFPFLILFSFVYLQLIRDHCQINLFFKKISHFLN